ncbi:unnamed protein product [Arabidopsis arenosa]|uniref:F-box domain-containing protein n=1 Tax=Arabidopsis arenosa TaxID=38785 RepID=A0A8S2B5N2_ARAAE|nr:unnamed protein product [Arabidopsis arenosa]
MMNTESFGACLLLTLPEDLFTVISRFLSPTDICNLILCGKSLFALVDSEKTWLVQCEEVKVLPLFEIVQWRSGISSYKALCRFLVEVVKPLVGIWVQQNPELGNVVYVMPGFLSVVGCRIIPQKVGPLWIQEGRVKWSPVFEIICGPDGSTGFFLHGRDKEGSCLYPGFVMGIDKSCNLLLLEVEPRQEKSSCNEIERGASRKEEEIPFWKLAFSDRKNLLNIVTSHVGLHVVEPLNGRLFPTSKDDEEMLVERRTMLLKMHKFGGNWKQMNLEEDDQLCYNPMQVDINEMLENLGDDFFFDMEEEEDLIEVTPTESTNVLGKSSSSKNIAPSKSEIRHSNRQSFLSSGDTFGLSLKAYYTDISSYEGWPYMHHHHFSLYKLPVKIAVDHEVYAGLWGGTFGWPAEKSPKEKPEKSLYLLMLTYEESKEYNERVLIGTKILEGKRYVGRPNGTAMFIVNIDTPSLEPFPVDADEIDFENSYSGNGIAEGYGFRYPGSKPGSLFVITNDLLAFVWQETKDVITLQRLNLAEILKKGLGSCVPPLPPTKNFTYMRRSYINEFTKSSTDPSYSDE